MKTKRIILTLSTLTIIVLAALAASKVTGKSENCSNMANTCYDSYHGLVMAGYQGWFNAPDDGAGRGWYHYKGSKGFRPGSASVDMWPDVSEYAKTYPTEFRMDDGSPAHVFSSHDESTVDTHFGWMKKYGLDGVFMQRFIGEISSRSGKTHFNHVLASAMKAAAKYDRAICIMYDLSGMRPGGEDIILRDIDELDTTYHFAARKACPTYLHHNGRPLVAVWGVGFNDGRRYGLKEARAIVDGLKSKGYSVLLGVPTYWREMRTDTDPDPEFHRLIKDCDIIMPWFVGRYDERSYDNFSGHIASDKAWCEANGVDYVPLVFPGFSWANMKGEGSLFIPRNRGSFFWKQLRTVTSLGCDMIYVAMFDEIDEGTAIFKVSESVPVEADGSRFIPLDQGIGSDYYLRLVGEASRAIKDGNGLSERMPSPDNGHDLSELTK